MINYKVINWKSIKGYEKKLVLIGANSPEITMEVSVSEDERRELLVVDKYISYSTNHDGTETWIHIYHIQSRAFDLNGNLILFTKSEIIK